jgi:hypothetical protein
MTNCCCCCCGRRNAGCACCVQWWSWPPAARCPLPLPTTAPTEGPIINAGSSREILSFTCGPDLHHRGCCQTSSLFKGDHSRRAALPRVKGHVQDRVYGVPHVTMIEKHTVRKIEKNIECGLSVVGGGCEGAANSHRLRETGAPGLRKILQELRTLLLLHSQHLLMGGAGHWSVCRVGERRNGERASCRSERMVC